MESVPGTLEASLAAMLTEFKKFLLRGNVVDLAVAVVIGAAFTALVNAFVKDLITPLIAAIGGKRDFSALQFEINGSAFLYGDFINAALTFLIVAAVVFFFVVKPVNALLDRFQTEQPLQEETRECPQCISQIPARASRCSFCTSDVSPVPG